MHDPYAHLRARTRGLASMSAVLLLAGCQEGPLPTAYTPVQASASAQPAPPLLEWSPDGHDFGTLEPGATASQEFTLTNVGAFATGSLSVGLAGGAAFSITHDACTGTSLGPDKSCAVSVDYSPTAPGQNDAATLTASGKNPLGSTVGSALAGASAAAPAPNLTLDPGDRQDDSWPYFYVYLYDFGPVTGFVSQSFTVTNEGNAASRQLTVVGPVANDGCSGSSLAPNETCSFDVVLNQPPGCVSGSTWYLGVDVIGYSTSHFIPHAYYIQLTRRHSCA